VRTRVCDACVAGAMSGTGVECLGWGWW